MTTSKNFSTEQELIDICFSIALTIQDNQKFFSKLDKPTIAKWVAERLRQCGYDTIPMGCSWGILVEREEKINHSINNSISIIEAERPN